MHEQIHEQVRITHRKINQGKRIWGIVNKTIRVKEQKIADHNKSWARK